MDDLYRMDERLQSNSETAFCRLMFRTPTKMNAAGFLQNDVMLSYQKSLEDFFSGQGLSRKKNIWSAKPQAKGPPPLSSDEQLDFAAFKTALADMAKEYGVFCEVSLEERMGCGVGACVGCVARISRNGEEKLLRVCKDGPVFNAEEVLF